MKKLTVFSLLLVSLSFIAIQPALATDGQGDSSTPEAKTQRHSEAESAFSKLEDHRDKVIAGCQIITTKVAERLSKDKTKEAKHAEQYTELSTKVSDLISRAKSAGYDTSTLAAELVVLKTKVATFQADKATYITSLQSSQTDACGKSQGEFKDAIITAHTDLAAVFADAKSIHDYLNSTIKPSIKALKLSIQPTASPAASSSAQ
jgi:peptidoglycan hydrolase-like amidase